MDSDKFGLHAELALKNDFLEDDPEDKLEQIRLRNAEVRPQREYIDTVKDFLSKNQFWEAVDFVENRMLKIDKVGPDSYIYDLLIGYCGRAGDVKSAYRMYTQIRKRGRHVTGGQYTSMFNACANSLQSAYALEIAYKVRQALSKDEYHRPNIKNFNVMMKAFGRHGDLKTCLIIMDEALQKRKRVLSDSYSFLFQACNSDKNSGFRHVLLLWHKLLVNKTDPDIYNFNLVLRAVRDCSIGDPTDFENTIKNILDNKSKRHFRTIQYKLLSQKANIRSLPALQSGSSQLETTQSSDLSESIGLKLESETNLPNLLALKPTMGSVLNINAFTTPYHRLQLIGGVTGFLEVMATANVKPNFKTFTLLLEILPPTEQFENDLLAVAEFMKVKLDTGFFNELIKRRSFRFDDEAARKVINKMQLHGLTIDLITFGVLALGCRTKEQGQTLINDLHAANFRLNSAILCPMIRNASVNNDKEYATMLLKALKKDNVKPDPKVLVYFKNFMDLYKTIPK